MAEYLVLIWDDEAAWAAADTSIVEETLAAHRLFIQRNAAALRGGNRLRPSSTATSVRHHPDGVSVTDGAFVESKEVIGGYYLIEAADAGEALAIARQVPAPFGGVELRPVWPTG